MEQHSYMRRIFLVVSVCEAVSFSGMNDSNEHHLIPGIEATCDWLEANEYVGRGDGLLHSMIMIDELCCAVRGQGLTSRITAVAGRVMALNYRFNNMPQTEWVPGQMMFSN